MFVRAGQQNKELKSCRKLTTAKAVELTIPITLTIIEEPHRDWYLQSHEHIHEVVDKVGYLIIDLVNGDRGGSFLVRGERTALHHGIPPSIFLKPAAMHRNFTSPAQSELESPLESACGQNMDAWNWWNECLEHYYFCIRQQNRECAKPSASRL